MRRSNAGTVIGWALNILTFWVWLSPAWAQADGTLAIAGTQKFQTAPVVVNGEVLFTTIGIEAYPATTRARNIERAIEALAENAANDPDDIAIVEEDDQHTLMLGDRKIMGLVNADARFIGLESRMLVAKTYRDRIVDAIKTYRRDRTAEQIRENLLRAGLRTLALILILAFMRWFFRLADRFLEKYFKRRIQKLEARSRRVINAEQIWRVVRAGVNLLKVAVVAAVLYFFLSYVLTLFPWTRYFARKLVDLIIDPLEVMAHGFVTYLPSLFFLIVLFIVVRYLLRVLYGFFEGLHHGNIRLKNFEADWAWSTYRIVRLVTLIFAVVIAYPYIPGSSSEAFKGVSLFVGVLLSLGSTSVISNIIAGYTMTYRRAFRTGDLIRIGETLGEVVEARLLVTHLRSPKNERVVVPNSTLLNSEITNYTTMAKAEGLILHTQVGIGYETPWRQVEAMLIEAAKRTAGVLSEPPPFVLQKALTDFAVTYELNAYSKQESNMLRTYSQLHRNIQDVFNEYGVQIMTPHYEADTNDPKLVPREKWFIPPAAEPNPNE